MNAKPPNILVYTGDNDERFKEVKENILKCLQVDSYVVYHLLSSEINESPWAENALLLVVSSDIIENAVALTFEKYLKSCGNILLICSKIDSSLIGKKCFQVFDEDKLTRVHFEGIGKSLLFRGKYSYDSDGTILCRDDENKCLIQKITCNKNVLITSEIYLDRDPKVFISSEYRDNRLSILKHLLTKELSLLAKTDSAMPELTPGYLILNDKLREIDSLKLDHESVFTECKFKNLDEEIKMPIYFYHKNTLGPLNFDETLYFSKLHTVVYGQQIVYFPVITSTMEAAAQLLDYEGIVIVAGYQTRGRGRRSNEWISPKGCAMFTLHFTLSLSSNLGKKITILQHMASLAVVHGIKSQPMFEGLKLNIKWPNDIYYESIKIGGLIVTTLIQNDLAHVSIGWGVNVANSQPTSCLNDAIDKHNSENSSSLTHMQVEEVMASTISQMEYFIKDFEEFGPENFLTHYYRYWMHSNQRVTVNSNQQGIVIGIDEYGFIEVKTDNGEIFAFQPDGNRYDIMKNLIYPV